MGEVGKLVISSVKFSCIIGVWWTIWAWLLAVPNRLYQIGVDSYCLMDCTRHMVFLLFSRLCPIKSFEKLIQTLQKCHNFFSMTTSEPRKYFTNLSYNFFTLPLELRTEIYEWVLLRGCIWMCRRLDLQNDFLSVVSSPSSGQLLRTCRQIYDEALPVLYHKGVEFSVRSFDKLSIGLVAVSPTVRKHIHTISVYRVKFVRMGDIADDSESDSEVAQVVLLPKLPKLKQVIFDLDDDDWGDELRGDDPSETELVFEQLLQSTPGLRHPLSRYIEMLADCPDAVIRLHSLSSYSDLPYGWTAIDDFEEYHFLEDNHFREHYSVQVIVSIQKLVEDGREVSRWKFTQVTDGDFEGVDASGIGENEIVVWQTTR